MLTDVKVVLHEADIMFHKKKIGKFRNFKYSSMVFYSWPEKPEVVIGVWLLLKVPEFKNKEFTLDYTATVIYDK